MFRNRTSTHMLISRPKRFKSIILHADTSQMMAVCLIIAPAIAAELD